VLHSFRFNGVSLYDALGWQAVIERVLSLPVSPRLFSSYSALLERSARLEGLDPLFKELSSTLNTHAQAARTPVEALEAWALRHTLCTSPLPIPHVDGFSTLTVAASLDVFAHAAPWELSVLPARLVEHFNSLLPRPAGVSVVCSSLHPSSILAPAVKPGTSVISGDLVSLADCVGPSPDLVCVFLPHLDPRLAPSPSLVLSIAELLDGALPLEHRLELAALLSLDKPMLSV
jgi:hypothetical protein